MLRYGQQRDGGKSIAQRQEIRMKSRKPQINEIAKRLFPDAQDNIESGLCPMCKRPVREFKDEESRKEYLISGLCQGCQDEVFGNLKKEEEKFKNQRLLESDIIQPDDI